MGFPTKNKAAIARVAEDWKLDGGSTEIRRKKRPWYKLRWPRTYQVGELYRFVQAELSSEAHVHEENAMDHNAVKGVPKRFPAVYRLLNKWTIPDKDVKTLTHGPLIDQNGRELVKEGNYLNLLVQRAKQQWWWTALFVLFLVYKFFSGQS